MAGLRNLLTNVQLISGAANSSEDFMKTCNTCEVFKDSSEFYKKLHNLDGLNKKCIACEREYRKSHYLSNKRYYKDKNARLRLVYMKDFVSFLETKACLDCGNSDFRVLEFDHLPQFIKSFNIADKSACTPLKTLMKEIDKCEIVCANCHRIRTSDRAGYYSYV